MKGFLLLLTLLLSASITRAQTSHGNLYQPEANASSDIQQAIKKAASENKHVLLQIGGNWCIWCYRFHNYVQEDEELAGIVQENFVVYHLNFSKENRNDGLLKKYGFPQRFGFPVFVILDAKGNRLHTQDSALLESGDSYDKRKVKDFFLQWTPKAVNPAAYSNQ